MRVCIVGCGAVGSLFAASLAQLDDVEVWAYDLAREHVDAINANGLRLSGAGEVVGQVRATTDATELPPCDFGIVATKAMHTEPAIAATAPAFADGAVASVQNGIGNEEVLAGHVQRVIRGTTFPAGRILEPGQRIAGPTNPGDECLGIEEEIDHSVVELTGGVVTWNRRRDPSGDPFEGAELTAVTERERNVDRQPQRFIRAPGRQPMLQRARLVPMVLEPARRHAVRLIGGMRRPHVHLMPQRLDEQVVIAVPLIPPIEGDDEESLLLGLVQQPDGIRLT